ncbi:MAG TPA: helix-turn-helix transcriptional regulator [Verrucomicrobiae bacterium]|nr:helix-turn-helix transcriptional regulator [Verrucomicrobiae bacterium]
MERSTRGIDYQEVPRPVAVLVDEYPPRFVDPPHSHRRAQLLYACSGVISLITEDATFTIPPQRAVWIPPGVVHEAHTMSAVSLRTLYVDAPTQKRMPPVCRVLEVSNLLRELILAAAQLPVEYETTSREGRIMDLILDELSESARAAPLLELQTPMPRDPRLVRICRQILQEPDAPDSIDDYADAAGMARRTFTRTFRRETGISFNAWRLHVRLTGALSRLTTGASITEVAFEVGYNSPSAFTAMFKRAFGVAPTHYFATPAAEPEPRAEIVL